MNTSPETDGYGPGPTRIVRAGAGKIVQPFASTGHLFKLSPRHDSSSNPTGEGVGLGTGVGAGVGTGVGTGVGCGDGEGLGVGCGVGFGVGVGAGVGGGGNFTRTDFGAEEALFP